MKILVTGAVGGLGGELPFVFPDDELVLLPRADLDITDQQAVGRKITAVRPDVIIHTAAYTKVDQAETDRQRAEAVNVTGTRNVAEAARATDAMLVYPSTDYVFDGTKGSPYTEQDEPNPLSVYGQTKLDGEAAARANPKTFVLRTSWLYSHTGKSFVTTMRRLFAEKAKLSIVDDEVSSPTYSRDFATTVRKLLPTEAYGLYHVASGGETSWYGFAQEIARQTGSAITIEPTTSAAYGLPAKRPARSTLDTAKLRQLGVTLPTWQEGLAAYWRDAEAQAQASRPGL